MMQWKKKIFLYGILGMLAVLSAGCGQVAMPSTQNLSAKTERALARSNSPEAIDAELTQRLAEQKQAAAKIVAKEDGQIIVRHKYGTTVMPKHPKRIVVLRLEDLTEALDVPVVGANYTPSYYLYDRFKDKNISLIHVNDETKTINYEEVQAAQPDLILLRDSFDQGVYDKLSKIAPVAAFNIRKEETALLALSMALDEEDVGIERLQEFYRHVKTYRIGLHEAMGDKKVAFLRVMNREIRLYPYSTNDIDRFLYDLLNLQPPSMVLAADQSKSNNAISLEWLPDLNADYLLVSTGYGTSSGESGNVSAEKYKKLQQDAIWQTIPAVQQGKVHEVNTSIWNAHGIIAKELAMKEIYDTWGK